MIIKKIITSLLTILLLSHSPLSFGFSVSVLPQSYLQYLPSLFILIVLPYLLFTIYKLRRSRHQLNISEKRLKSTVEGSGDTLWDWHITNKQVFRINDKYALNRSNNVDFPPHRTLIHPHDITQVEQLLKQHFAHRVG
ncbi:MAG: hypothetical protein ACTILD_08210 [Pseudoalteromonas sp.]